MLYHYPAGLTGLNLCIYFYPLLLAAEQGELLEEALWSALRILEERARLDRRIAEDTRQRAMTQLTGHFETRAVEAERQADMIRQILFNGREPLEEDEAA